MQSVHTDKDGHLKYMVCHDGSPASLKALKITARGYMNDTTDHLYCAHAFSFEK